MTTSVDALFAPYIELQQKVRDENLAAYDAAHGGTPTENVHKIKAPLNLILNYWINNGL